MYKIKHTDDYGNSMWISLVDENNIILCGRDNYDGSPSFHSRKAHKICSKNKNCELVETTQETAYKGYCV